MCVGLVYRSARWGWQWKWLGDGWSPGGLWTSSYACSESTIPFYLIRCWFKMVYHWWYVWKKFRIYNACPPASSFSPVRVAEHIQSIPWTIFQNVHTFFYSLSVKIFAFNQVLRSRWFRHSQTLSLTTVSFLLCLKNITDYSTILLASPLSFETWPMCFSRLSYLCRNFRIQNLGSAIGKHWTWDLGITCMS